MKFQPRRPDDPDLNMTSLIDVVLLLLIFFMMSTKLRRRGPAAGPAARGWHRSRRQPRCATTVEIEVTAEGGYRVDGRDAGQQQPGHAVRGAGARVRRQPCAVPVTIRADARATHQSVVTAMDVAGRLGYRQINIATVTMGQQEHDERADAADARRGAANVPSAARRTCGPHRPMFAVGVLGMMMFAATDAGWAAFVQFFLDGTFVNKDPRMVWLVPIALIGLFLLRGVGDFLQTYCPGFVGRHIVKTLRAQIFDRYVHLPVSFFDSQRVRRAAVASSRTTPSRWRTATTDSITVFIRDTLTILGPDRLPAVPELEADAVQPDRRAADRVPDPAHQPAVPPLQPAHPEFDGRRDARGQGGDRGAARDPRLQCAGLRGADVRAGHRAQPPLAHEADADQGAQQPGRADDRVDRSRGRAVPGDRRCDRRGG